MFSWDIYILLCRPLMSKTGMLYNCIYNIYRRQLTTFYIYTTYCCKLNNNKLCAPWTLNYVFWIKKCINVTRDRWKYFKTKLVCITMLKWINYKKHSSHFKCFKTKYVYIVAYKLLLTHWINIQKWTNAKLFKNKVK